MNFQYIFVLLSNLVSNLASLCMRLINSAVMVGLYYGFLTTLSMVGPAYLFYLRIRVLEKGSQKEVSAISGFLMGQLIMFISIYYEPLYITLSSPHTITFVLVPYICFYFFWNNRDDFLDDSGSIIRKSMRNLSIQCEYLNNVICQLLNHFFLRRARFKRGKAYGGYLGTQRRKRKKSEYTKKYELNRFMSSSSKSFR